MQVVSRDWVRRITSLVTPLDEMNPPHRRALGTGTRWSSGRRATVVRDDRGVRRDAPAADRRAVPGRPVRVRPAGDGRPVASTG